VTFETLFIGVLIIIANWLVAVLASWTIVVSNGIAGAVMGIYLLRQHPRLRDALNEPSRRTSSSRAEMRARRVFVISVTRTAAPAPATLCGSRSPGRCCWRGGQPPRQQRTSANNTTIAPKVSGSVVLTSKCGRKPLHAARNRGLRAGTLAR
jgi:hypothetical protein